MIDGDAQHVETVSRGAGDEHIVAIVDELRFHQRAIERRAPWHKWLLAEEWASLFDLGGHAAARYFRILEEVADWRSKNRKLGADTQLLGRLYLLGWPAPYSRTWDRLRHQMQGEDQVLVGDATTHLREAGQHLLVEASLVRVHHGDQAAVRRYLRRQYRWAFPVVVTRAVVLGAAVAVGWWLLRS